MGKAIEREAGRRTIDFFSSQGDQGYCYIPYDYMTNAEFCFDAWAIRQIAANDFGRDHWDNYDQINYMDNMVNPGTDDYDMGEIIEDEDDTDNFFQW